MTIVTERDPNQVIIFDTTLRDGEQSPGASMNLEEKLRIAKVLEDMGVDVIEAGFPIASEGDFEAVSEIAKTIKNSTIAGLARATRGDIERAGRPSSMPSAGASTPSSPPAPCTCSTNCRWSRTRFWRASPKA